MSENPIRIEYEYFPDPTRGRPVSNGAVYVGLEKTDPTVLINRVDVVLIQQDGTRVTLQPSAQPFSTSPGGVIEYQGSPAIIRVNGVVSIAVHDSIGGNQVYYNPTANQDGGGGGGAPAVSAATGTPLNGSFEVETTPTEPDNWTLAPASNATIAIDNTVQSHGFKSLKFTSASAAGAGSATSDRFNVLSSAKSDIRFSLQSTSVNVLNTVQIRYYDSLGAVLTTNTVFSDGATNQPVFVDHIVTDLAPTGAVECELVLNGVTSSGATTNGSTWFDNVIFTNLTGTYLVGSTGSVIKTIDNPNNVNFVQIANAAAGVSPSIDQAGVDDLGVLIEQVLIKNGIISGNFVGDLTGDVTGSLFGNADTVTVVPALSGDVSNVGNVITVEQVPPGVIGSAGIKTTIVNVATNVTIPPGSTINIAEVGLLYVAVTNTGNNGTDLSKIEVNLNGSWVNFVDHNTTGSRGTFVFSNGSNVRVREDGGSQSSATYTIDKIED